LNLPLCTVDIRNSLPQVELCVFLGGDAFDLDEGSVRAGVALGAFVPQEAALCIESGKEGKRGQFVIWKIIRGNGMYGRLLGKALSE
jgi:hypothetical protein